MEYFKSIMVNTTTFRLLIVLISIFSVLMTGLLMWITGAEFSFLLFLASYSLSAAIVLVGVFVLAVAKENYIHYGG